MSKNVIAIKVDAEQIIRFSLFSGLHTCLEVFTREGGYPEWFLIPFAVKFIAKKPYVSFQEVNTSDKNVGLNFEALTLDKLKNYKNQLNRIE